MQQKREVCFPTFCTQKGVLRCGSSSDVNANAVQSVVPFALGTSLYRAYLMFTSPQESLISGPGVYVEDTTIRLSICRWSNVGYAAGLTLVPEQGLRRE